MKYITEFNFDTFPFTKEARKTLEILGLKTEKEKLQLEDDINDFLICVNDDIPTEMGINCFLEDKTDVIAGWYGYESWEELVKDKIGTDKTNKTAEEKKEKYHTKQKKMDRLINTIDRLINKYDIKIQGID